MTDPQSPLSGKAFRDAFKRATSGRAKALRNRRGTWPRKPDRGAGAAYKPGMARRMPPPPPQDGEKR